MNFSYKDYKQENSNEDKDDVNDKTWELTVQRRSDLGSERVINDLYAFEKFSNYFFFTEFNRIFKFGVRDGQEKDAPTPEELKSLGCLKIVKVEAYDKGLLILTEEGSLTYIDPIEDRIIGNIRLGRYMVASGMSISPRETLLALIFKPQNFTKLEEIKIFKLNPNPKKIKEIFENESENDFIKFFNQKDHYDNNNNNLWNENKGNLISENNQRNLFGEETKKSLLEKNEGLDKKSEADLLNLGEEYAKNPSMSNTPNVIDQYPEPKLESEIQNPIQDTNHTKILEDLLSMIRILQKADLAKNLNDWLFISRWNPDLAVLMKSITLIIFNSKNKNILRKELSQNLISKLNLDYKEVDYFLACGLYNLLCSLIFCRKFVGKDEKDVRKKIHILGLEIYFGRESKQKGQIGNYIDYGDDEGDIESGKSIDRGYKDGDEKNRIFESEKLSKFANNSLDRFNCFECNNPLPSFGIDNLENLCDCGMMSILDPRTLKIFNMKNKINFFFCKLCKITYPNETDNLISSPKKPFYLNECLCLICRRKLIKF